MGGSETGSEGATALPGGLVTFLFTDIEGSTALFRALGDRFPPLLDMHNDLLRAVWRRHRGVEVKTEGDAFFVAFADPTDAVQAGVAAVEALAGHVWPADAEIRARVGMHTGVGYPRNDDYIAYPVHQAARIGAVGHGGQVVVSPETAQLLSDLGDIGLHDLGAYRVRDFDEPIHLFQAERSDDPTQFPALRAQTDVQHNLPSDLPEAFGRAGDIKGIADQMSQSRAVTIVGPGGVGKTLLARTVASQHVEDFTDGVWFVDLSSHRDGTTLRGAVADVFGVQPDELRDHLAARRLLVVLDNAEQAAADVGRMLVELLAGAPGLSVLLTSREPLTIAPERLWRLEPLAADGASVDLFSARARAVDPAFDVDANRAQVIELCERLDGMPLAIELAAARVTALSVGEIIESLSDRLRVLRSRRRDLDDRQRTATGLVDWSYQLLDDDEKLVFRRLGVFADQFDLDLATAGCEDSGLDRIDVADIVWSLVEKSLVMPVTADGATRYRLLETLKAFGVAAMTDADELTTVLTQVGMWFRAQFDPSKALTRATTSGVSSQLGNLRSLAIALADHNPGLGQWIAWIVGLHYKTIDPTRGLAELEPMVERLAVPGEAVVAMMAAQAHLANAINEVELSASIVDRAQRFVDEASEIPIGTGWLRNVAALNAIKNHDLVLAGTIAQAAIAEASELEQVSLLNTAAIVHAELGDLDAAAVALEEVHSLAHRHGALDAEVVSAGGLGEIAHRRGDLAVAGVYTLQAIRTSTELGLRSQSALSTVGAARLVADAGDLAEAVVLHAAADQLMAETGQKMFDVDQVISDQLLARARTSLGDDAFAAAADQGRALSYAELAERAQAALQAATPAPLV